MNETPTSPSAAEFERQLFASAHHDRVPEASRQRVALALGLAPLGGAVELGSPSPPGPPAPTLVAASPGKLALLSKSLLVGLVGGREGRRRCRALAHAASSSRTCDDTISA